MNLFDPACNISSGNRVTDLTRIGCTLPEVFCGETVWHLCLQTQVAIGNRLCP